MARKRVASSHLKSVGYNKDERKLEVEFRDGSVYEYGDIAHQTHTGILKSSSRGRSLSQNVKKAGKPYRRLN